MLKSLNNLRRYRWILLSRRRYKAQIKKLGEDNQIKLNIGSGSLNYTGWLNLNLPLFDLTKEYLWEYFFKDSVIRNILLEHVLEHLTHDDVGKSLTLAKKYLCKDSKIRIAVPDKNHPNPDYIEYVRPGGSGAGADDHKSFWNYSDFKDLVDSIGYDINFIEYWDEHGKIQMNELDETNGIIQRTKRNILKNSIPDYSSLIVDLTLK